MSEPRDSIEKFIWLIAKNFICLSKIHLIWFYIKLIDNLNNISALNLFEKCRNQKISDPLSEPLESQIHTQINKIKGENATTKKVVYVLVKYRYNRCVYTNSIVFFYSCPVYCLMVQQIETHGNTHGFDRNRWKIAWTGWGIFVIHVLKIPKFNNLSKTVSFVEIFQQDPKKISEKSREKSTFCLIFSTKTGYNKLRFWNCFSVLVWRY